MTKENKKPKSLKVEFDYARYAHHLDGEDMSEDEKRECLGALWDILSEFVQLGFDVHPVQQAGAACTCGKVTQDLPKPANSSRPAVYSGDTQNDKNKEELAYAPV